MDQDLALMRQLLTLNEQIEEMKWRRKLGGYLNPAHFSQSSSSCYLPGGYSSSSVATSASGLALAEPALKYPSPSELSLLHGVGQFSTQESLLADRDEEGKEEEDPTTPTPGRAGQRGFGRFSEALDSSGVTPSSQFDREGSNSTRSTSDLGSSGEDSSVTDLTKTSSSGDDDDHNVTLTASDTPHNVPPNQKYIASKSGSEPDGYYSMEKEQCVRVGPLYEPSEISNTAKQNSYTSVSSENPKILRGDQHSTDSGIQDTDPALMELLI